MNQLNSQKWYIQWNLNLTKLIWVSALYLLCWFKIKDKLKQHVKSTYSPIKQQANPTFVILEIFKSEN